MYVLHDWLEHFSVYQTSQPWQLCCCYAEYGFGTTLYGSCGFTSQNGTEAVTQADVPVANNMVAALANTAIDYPGSCGRCGLQLPSLVQPAMCLWCSFTVQVACGALQGRQPCVAVVTLLAVPDPHSVPCSRHSVACAAHLHLSYFAFIHSVFHSVIAIQVHNQALMSSGPCRCYEVRCQDGLVIANYTGPASNPTSAAELQTISQGYVPAENVSAVTDTFGRTAPANPLLSKNLIYTSCWNNTLVRAGCPSRCIIVWQLLCQ